MAVPKQHKTKSRRNQRRMHIYLKTQTLSSCSKCGKAILPHIICFNCGYYKGKEIIDTLKKLTKKERKSKEKEMSAKEMAEKGGGEKREGSTWEELSKK